MANWFVHRYSIKYKRTFRLCKNRNHINFCIHINVEPPPNYAESRRITIQPPFDFRYQFAILVNNNKNSYRNNNNIRSEKNIHYLAKGQWLLFERIGRHHFNAKAQNVWWKFVIHHWLIEWSWMTDVTVYWLQQRPRLPQPFTTQQTM